MNYFLVLLTIVNTFGLAYLTFIIYRKNASSLKNVPSNPVDVTRPLKITVTRFNPFEDLGGDQSFILCLLDNRNDGAIITSLHNRDSTRVYAKAIKNGQSDNSTLSKEETKALIKTINS